jgi:hypothetical protein
MTTPATPAPATEWTVEPVLLTVHRPAATGTRAEGGAPPGPPRELPEAEALLRWLDLSG